MAMPYQTYNARIESAHVKPAFAESTKSMRAIIPASGYYEWKSRRPFYFHAPDDSPLFLAGLYSWWRQAPTSPWILTAAIITCPAAEEFADIHDRMPLQVPRDMADVWLDPSKDGEPLLRAAENAGIGISRALRFHEVAALSGDGAHLIQPLPRDETPTLF